MQQHFFTGGGIQPLVVLVMAAALLVPTTNSSSPDPHLRETSFDHLTLNDVLFTENVLQNVSARSRIECSKKCVETEGCVMCTFHSSPQGPPGLCQLHSQRHTASDVKQSMPGAKSMARRSACAGGYVLACDRCLKAVNDEMTYTTAKQQCSQMKGQLALAKSREEVDCIWSVLMKNGLDWVWLGAHDNAEAGVFRWTDGTLLPDSSPLWSSNEPDNSEPGDDCVNIRASGAGLQDSPCHTDCHFMCQMDTMN